MSKTILVVDDDRLFILQLRKILSDAGYRVLHAFSGTEAIQRFQQVEIDLAIIDLVMPSQGGYETIRQIKKGKPDVKLIATSSVSKHFYFEIAEYLGANASMPKQEAGVLPTAKWLKTVENLLHEPRSNT